MNNVYNIRLTENELNLILDSLSRLPYIQVVDLINKICNEVKENQEEQNNRKKEE